MSIHCYAALTAKQALQKFEYDPKPLGVHDVEIQISHCGICHSDLHLIDNDWQRSVYPLVPGHEIIGVITALGNEVKHLQKGQRVGVGWLANACGHCEWCERGQENLCASKQATCVGNHGGFAEAIRVSSHFAFPIPDALVSETAAPLLCGGITVYSPLHRHVTAGTRVGIVGVGGLGHMALQFAHALGAEVTAFSSSAQKIQETKHLGADHFVASNDKQALQTVANSLDFILVTATANLDWLDYINVLRPNGNLCFVSGLTTPVTVPIMTLIGNRKTVSGSNTGGCPEITEMLAFAAQHKIAAQTEVLPMDQVNAALDKVRANKARYRVVLMNR